MPPQVRKNVALEAGTAITSVSSMTSPSLVKVVTRKKSLEKSKVVGETYIWSFRVKAKSVVSPVVG